MRQSETQLTHIPGVSLLKNPYLLERALGVVLWAGFLAILVAR